MFRSFGQIGMLCINYNITKFLKVKQIDFVIAIIIEEKTFYNDNEHFIKNVDDLVKNYIEKGREK